MTKFPVACKVTALSPEQRERRAVLAKKLLKATDEVHELKNGYAFAYSLKAVEWMEIAEFTDLERRCCPFFVFTLQLNPAEHKIRLQLTGDEGVKEFLQSHDDFAV